MKNAAPTTARTNHFRRGVSLIGISLRRLVADVANNQAGNRPQGLSGASGETIEDLRTPGMLAPWASGRIRRWDFGAMG